MSLPANAAISGQLRSTTDFFTHDFGEPTEKTIPFLSAELANKKKLSKRWRMRWRLTASGNLETKAKDSNKFDPESEKTYLDAPEFNFEWRFRDFKFRFGMNTVNWGVVDLNSPSDTVNTQAMFHPLRPIKRGAGMIETQWGPEAFALHTIYIPRQARPILPATDSRWFPREFLLENNGADSVKIPDELNYEYVSDEDLNNALDNNYGARLTSHVGSWDFQLTHFEGTAITIRPTFTTVFSSDPDYTYEAVNPISLAPVYYRVRTSGLGMVYAGERWIYRLESAYQHTVSTDDFGFATKGESILQPWSWMSVAAIETNASLGSTTLTILAQYYHTENPQSPNNQITSAYRLFDRTGILGFRWAASDDTTVMASALLETQTQGLFWMAGFETKVADSLKMSLGWRDFSAQKDGLLKTYDKADHATLDLIYYF